MDEPYFSKAYHGTTTIHPLAVAAIVVLGLLVFALPRRQAIWPMIIMACFISQAQRIVIFGSDFNMLRIMVVLGWMRLLLRNELIRLKLHRLDIALVLWTTVRTLAVVLQGWGSALLILQLGRAFDAIGMYFLFRMLLRDWAGVRSAVWAVTVISLPVALAFMYESATSRNLFAIFGGLPEVTTVRGERLRCQGAFAHPILAGCFWASMLPLVAAQIYHRRGRITVIASIAAICIVVIACASSTPVMAVLLGMVGGAAFFIRRHMRVVRWSAIVAFFGLALVMNQPVWHLLARVHIVSGSSSWHRYKLIDACVAHWQEWFVLGSSKGSAHWGPGLYDITNDYVVQALQGGILQLLLFIAIIVIGFQFVGRLCRSVQRDRAKLWMAWALGVCLFIHALNFIAVTYFGQIILIWHLLLAMIGTLVPLPVRAKRAARQEVRQSPQPDWPSRAVPVSS